MVQITIRRSHLMIATGAIALLLAVAWTGIASRASAASSTPVVYVATGQNFPDALGAASAAAVQGGPVLLVTKTSIPAETKSELQRLSPAIIYVAGGTAVISDAVFSQLKAYAPTVKRVAGANRYATAVEVSKSAFPVTGGATTAALEARIQQLEAQVQQLDPRIQQLETLLAGVTRNSDTLMFSGMNLQVVNGQGSTTTSNGLGNIIIGYNDTPPPPLPAGYRNGSHYLIVGDMNTYTAFGGIVAGVDNRATGSFASVIGGSSNTASGPSASVTGGSSNTAEGDCASVTGGFHNTAGGDHASITGGYDNTAPGANASVTGGYDNTAGGNSAYVAGGSSNTASGNYSSIAGGSHNTVSGSCSSMLGGSNNSMSGDYGIYPYCGC